jgi:hypothetical protein
MDMTQLQGTETDGAKILHRVLHQIAIYSPAANGCSGEWASEFKDYEIAQDFLWAHFYQHFGREKA